MTPNGYLRKQVGPDAHTFEFKFRREYSYQELVIEILVNDWHGRIFTTFDEAEYDRFVQTGLAPDPIEHPVISLLKPVSPTVVVSEEFQRRLRTVIPGDRVWKTAVRYRFTGYAGCKDGDYVLLMRRRKADGGYF